MAKIQLGTENGATLGNPPSGDYWFFNDSNNSNQYTRRDSSGTDIILSGGGGLLAANNLSDVASSLTSFNNIKQSATTVLTGVGEIATQTEVNTGTDPTRWVTAETLNNWTGGGGGGDMLAATYDPTGQANDVYNYANALGITQITGTIITPTTLTATTDDYNPTGFATCNMIRQDINANNRQITGFVAPSVGVNRIIRINNINTSGFDLRFQNNDAGSAVANRLLLRDDANKSIKPNETAIFWYDHTSSRWRAYNRIG